MIYQTEKEDVYELKHPIVYDSVMSLFKEGMLLLKKHQQLSFDLQNIQTYDGSLVALLLLWKREAKKQNISISYQNMSDHLLGLAQFFGVEGLL